ncbi:divalent cation tolerance protein [Persephonella hydrogeniphila]|uniref:Divalent cation tolerance protein n=1 Tax=Persephonella hydrogeniphila TaxID=198703 RepID=A0A285NJY3_9AQUI|nr:divalent-cation tolerance protein CutA [Persephonella hydrogeniphila]SNZ08186.1 divalent cation tolerance protein [Persephonella hydrogeniphila]
MGYIVVLVTTPDKETAERLALGLIENKLAACVNISEQVSSVYFWQGNIENEKESLMIIKSREDLFEDLEQFIRKNHPYTVPEIIALPIIKGSSAYLNWIDETVDRK